jgi:redox-sensitive bicupin YhaK (pirin superfamily)
MVKIRRSGDRGYADHGWLKSYYTFSFAQYFDSQFVHFRNLRVINEDWIAPEKGFGTHPHEDMEIITYILRGALSHKDSMGNGSVINPGDVQRMTAGTGIQHSEFNHSKNEEVHLLQIWIFPSQKNLKPSYEQKNFSEKEKRNQLRIVASPDGTQGSVTVHQDVALYSSLLDPGKSIRYQFKSGRSGWLQLISGELKLSSSDKDEKLMPGDAAIISDEKEIELTGLKDSEFLFFDLN